MVATNAFMYFPEYVVGGFLPYAFKNGRREASFIKGPPMNGESCRPRSEFGCLIHATVGVPESTKFIS